MSEQLIEQAYPIAAPVTSQDPSPLPDVPFKPMTEQEYEEFVAGWIGIPYQLNGADRKIGLDCRTLGISFLRAQGIAVKETDDEPIPDELTPEAIKRYEEGVKRAGVAVELRDLQRNDIVYYFNTKRQLHVGIWLGYDRILTTGEPYKSFIYRLKREQLAGAVRGREGIFLDNRGAVSPPPAHPPVVAVLAAIGTFVTLGVATGTAAVIVGAIVVGAAVAGAVHFGLGAMAAGRKSFDFSGSPAAGLQASPRYAFDGAKNIRSNQNPVPLIYSGLGIRVLQTYEIWNSGQGSETQKRLVVIGEGELGSITEVKLNGTDIASFSGSSYDAYVGTSSQGVDARAANTDVVGLKDTAYLALTLQASDKLSGDPVITCKVTGRKIKTWNGSVWSGASVSGNPAAIIRDYLTLTRERGGCGFPESVLDDASFGAVYDYCEATVTNLDGTTEPRARLDMIVDTFRPWLDNLTDMLATFGGFLVTDGRKFYLKVEKSESPVQAFTDDQIWDVEYQTFSKDDRPNRLIGIYIDPTAAGNDARTRVSIDDLTDQAANPRGIVPKEVNLLGLSRQTQTIREITKIANDLKTNWYSLTFTTDVNALAVEPGDVITVTHPILGDGATAYAFRVTRILENQDHTRKLICKAYTSGIFSDVMEQQSVTLSYTPPLNPFTPPPDVTGVAVTAMGFLGKDGVFVSNLQVTWTEPADKMGIDHYQVEWNEDGAGYIQRGTVSVGATKILLPNSKYGSTYTIRVKSVSPFGVKSNGAVSGSITISGDTTPPGDVTGFGVSFDNDHFHFVWNENADPDIWGYEIREGASWNLGVVIATKIATASYDLFSISAGTHTYWIKAIDTSGNYSVNAASDSLVITSIPASNVVFTHREFAEGVPGTLSGEAILKWTKSYSGGYYRQAMGLRTDPRWANKSGTWAQALAAGDKFNTPISSLTGGYVSSVIDIGAVMSPTITLNLGIANVQGGVLLVEIRASDDNVAWSAYRNFSSGVYSGRYFQFRLTISTTNSTYDTEVYDFVAIFDVPDLDQKGQNVSVDAGGTTVTFPQAFNSDPSLISIVVTSVGNPYIPEIVSGSKTKTQFQVKLKNTAGIYVSGTVDWHAKGY